MALVEVETDGAVAVLTLNRPEAMNALSAALQAALADAIRAAEGDDAVRVLILMGAGERAFSAGLDLKETGLGGRALEADPVRALTACTKPVIGAINGAAITGGFELALACDILIASTNARFADTHARVGVTPGWGLSQRLSRAIGLSRAKEMSFSGNFIDAGAAADWGLVNRVVAPTDLMPAALALAKDIAGCDPDMIRRYKALIDDGYGLALADGLAMEQQRSRADNAKVTPAAIAERRGAVQSRGRDQAGQP